MCPNCSRGLTYPKHEVCDLCAGTGIYNPNQTAMPEETIVAPEEVVVEAPVEVPAETPETAPVEEVVPPVEEVVE